MPSVLQRIRQKILQKQFVFSSHAIDEMLEDEIKPFDVDEVKNVFFQARSEKEKLILTAQNTRFQAKLRMAGY